MQNPKPSLYIKEGRTTISKSKMIWNKETYETYVVEKNNDVFSEKSWGNLKKR